MLVFSSSSGLHFHNKQLKSGLFGVAALLKKIFSNRCMMMDVVRPQKGANAGGAADRCCACIDSVAMARPQFDPEIDARYRVRSYGVLSLEEEILFDTLQWGF